MSDKAHEHTPDAPMPARPDGRPRDLAGGPGDTPSRPDGAVVDEEADGATRRRDGEAAHGRADAEKAEEGEPLSDIAAEVEERVRAGQGRDDAPEVGSQGALGKPETGEW